MLKPCADVDRININKIRFTDFYWFIDNLTNRYWFLSIDYPGCSSVWGNTVKSNISKSSAISAEFHCQDCFRAKEIERITEGRRSLKWLNNYEKILFNDLVLVLKCLNGLATSYLAHYFTTRTAIRSRNARRSWRLEPSTLTVVSGATWFLFSRAKQWNDLPKDLQNIKDIKVFKKRLFI